MASFLKWWLFLPLPWRATAWHTGQLGHILQLHWVPMPTRILSWRLRHISCGAAKGPCLRSCAASCIINSSPTCLALSAFLPAKGMHPGTHCPWCPVLGVCPCAFSFVLLELHQFLGCPVPWEKRPFWMARRGQVRQPFWRESRQQAPCTRSQARVRSEQRGKQW